MTEQLRYNPKKNIAGFYWTRGGLILEGANWTYDEETGLHKDIEITNSALVARVKTGLRLYGIHEAHIFGKDYTAYINPDLYMEKAFMNDIKTSEYYQELCAKPFDPKNIYDMTDFFTKKE